MVTTKHLMPNLKGIKMNKFELSDYDQELVEDVEELMNKLQWSRTDALLFILIRSIDAEGE